MLGAIQSARGSDAPRGLKVHLEEVSLGPCSRQTVQVDRESHKRRESDNTGRLPIIGINNRTGRMSRAKAEVGLWQECPRFGAVKRVTSDDYISSKLACMTRSIKTLATLFFVGCALAITSAAATDLPRNTRYLALGDSIAFGYNPLVIPVDVDEYVGYPEIVSGIVHRKVANASCFGESSGSFLVLNAPDVGCQTWRASFPLHVSYSGTQMQYVLDYLRANGKKTELITIDIGVNDLGVLLAGCNDDLNCAALGLPATLAAYAQNLTTIFTGIRQTGYIGPIIAVTPYAVNYNDQVEVTGLLALNGVLSQAASAFDVKVADVFTAFLAADIPFGNNSCSAGLLVKLPNNTCDIHPSLAGQTLIAQTIVGLIQ